MSSYAAVGIERIPVVDFAIEHVLSPPVPGRWVTSIAITECRIVHHVALVYVPLFRRGEFREPVRLRIERRRPESERAIEILLEERIQRHSTHALNYITKQHETEIAVVPRVADAPLERHVAYDRVGLA